MRTREKCSVCCNKNLVRHLSTQDFFGTNETFHLLRCEACQTLYTSPFPDQNESITYYKSNSYVSHGDSKGFLFDKIYSLAKHINLKKKYSILSKHVTPKRHLDIGCGTGDFLSYLKQKGIEVTGVEIDQNAKEAATKKGIQTFQTLQSVPKNTYDSISMIHVLEHVHELENYMNITRNLLSKKGILFLALPNFLSHDASVFKRYWAGYDVPRHLYHFSPQSIQTLADKFGLNLVKTYPMKFDSYYASLLSIQYSTRSTNYLKAFIQGALSNNKALKTGNFSSLIYILQK